MIFKERLRELGLFSLKQTRQRGDLSAVYTYLIRGQKEDGARAFLEEPDNRTRSKKSKLEHGKFWLRTRNFKFFIFTMTVVKYWNRLPTKVVKSPSLEVFKTRLDRALRNPCFEQVLDWMTYGCFFQHGKVQNKEIKHKRN